MAKGQLLKFNAIILAEREPRSESSLSEAWDRLEDIECQKADNLVNAVVLSLGSVRGTMA